MSEPTRIVEWLNPFAALAAAAKARNDEIEAALAPLGGPSGCPVWCDENGCVETAPVAARGDRPYSFVCRFADGGDCSRSRALLAAKQAGIDARVRTRLLASGVPSKFVEASFTSADRETEALSAAARYSGDPLRAGRSLVLSGRAGVGKTFAAACLARAWADLDRRLLWRNASDLFEEAREAPAWDRLRDVPLLVVDDLGTEYVADRGGWTKGRLDNLFRHRYDNGTPMIVTTNLDGAALEDRYEARIVSRLVEMCGGGLATCGGANLRIGTTDTREWAP